MNLTRTEFLAYTAGFFDADGSVGVYWAKAKDRPRGGDFRLLAQITQRLWLPIFEEWHGHWDGGVTHRHTRDGWYWTLYANQAASFLRDVLPYLRNKRDQAQLAIKFQERMRLGVRLTDAEHEWREAVSEALKDMKHTSEPAPSELLAQIERRVAELGKQLELQLDEGRNK